MKRPDTTQNYDLMTGLDNSTGYRYGYNGMEQDFSFHNADGESYDFGARMYDPRLGRWLSLDPLMRKYPSLSPYNFTLNNPLYYFDEDGRDVGKGTIVINNSSKPILISGDGQSIKVTPGFFGDSEEYVDGNSWEPNARRQDQFKLYPGQTFIPVKKSPVKNNDGSTTTSWEGKVVDTKTGVLIKEVKVFEIDFIEVVGSQIFEVGDEKAESSDPMDNPTSKNHRGQIKLNSYGSNELAAGTVTLSDKPLFNKYGKKLLSTSGTHEQLKNIKVTTSSTSTATVFKK